MKHLLTIPLFITTLSGSISVPNKIESGLNKFSICPLKLSGDTPMSFQCLVLKGDEINISVKIYNDLYVSGKEIYSTVISSGSNVIAYYNNQYTRDENEIEVTARVNGGKALPFCRRVIPLSSPKIKFITDTYSLREEASIYTYSVNRWTTSNPEYNFSGFENYYIPKFYHKLDLSDFKITTDSVNYSFLSSKASLIVENYPLKEGTTSFTIPLELVKGENNSILLRPSIKLFVEMETLEMSFAKKSNYVETRHFYLPRNEIRKQGDFDFSIVFEDFGCDQLKLVHSFKFNALMNIMGDCVNSEYCILKS